MTDVTLAKEDFSPALYAEIIPLAQKCWEESTRVKLETCAYFGEREFAVEPAYEVYAERAQAGGLVIVTLRAAGILKGYVLGFLYRSWHHKRILCGNGDSIYIEPEYRSYTPVVAERFEQEFAQLGVKILGWATHIEGPVYQFLKARGYVGDDIVMEKRLCA